MVEFYRHPVDAPISGTFGQWYGPPIAATPYQHRGVDYSCPIGTPVYAPCPGLVVISPGPSSGFGDSVLLQMRNGYYSIMAHNSQVAVWPGMTVETGQLVAYSGATGKVTGPHVHWQYCMSAVFPTDISQSLDPLLYLEENMMSPEERQRLETLENLFGGAINVQMMVAAGLNLKLQLDNLNLAIPARINEHNANGHGGYIVL